MLLDQAREQKSYRVVSIIDGKEVRLKLTSMGIYKDVIFKVIKNDGSGPIIIGIKSSRTSIGRKLSKKIEVTSDEQEN